MSTDNRGGGNSRAHNTQTESPRGPQHLDLKQQQKIVVARPVSK